MLVAFFLGFSVMGSDVGHIDTTDPLKTAQRGDRTFSSTVSVVKVANKNNKHGLANKNKSKNESWILALKKTCFITWSLAKLKHLRPFFWVASHAQRKPCRVPCPHGELWPAPKKKSVGAMPKERWKPCHLARTMGQGVVEGQILFSFWPLER